MRNRVDPNAKEKPCTSCLKVLPITDYNKRGASTDGRMFRCRDCGNADNRAKTARKSLRGSRGRGGRKSRFTAKQVYDALHSGEHNSVIAERLKVNIGTLYRWKNGDMPNTVADEVWEMLEGEMVDTTRTANEIMAYGTDRFARTITDILNGKLTLLSSGV